MTNDLHGVHNYYVIYAPISRRRKKRRRKRMNRIMKQG